MILNLPTKKYITGLLLVLSFYGIAQNQNNLKNDSISKNENNSKNYGPRWTISVDGVIPIPTGDKYIGLAMKGKGGYNFRTQIFLYQNVFASFAFGTTYLENTKPELVGNYKKTRIQHQTLYLGYEVLTTKNFKVGILASVYGESQHKNTYNGKDEAYQRDTGKVRSYEAYFAYNFNKHISVNVIYAYRNDKMNIETSPGLQSRFEKAQFHNIGLGLKFHFGSTDLISAFSK